MTGERIFPEPNCCHFSERVDKRIDSHVARMRFHQSWYRHNVLHLEPGPHPQAKARRTLYGNMLTPADAVAGRNFLTAAIFEHVRKRYPLKDGVAISNVYRNMLSSEPMCFNLFGPLKRNTQLATRLLRCLDGIPSDVTVVDVRFEYAPDKTVHLNDGTSFDCFIEYERIGGRRGFIGIETKFTEPFSQKEYEFAERYSKWMMAPDWWWKREAEDRFPEPLFNQLWRNHLLVFAMLRQPNAQFREGFCAVVYPAEDNACRDAISTYQALLTEAGAATLLDWQLNPLVTRWIESLKGRKEQDWLAQFRLRYLDWSASESDWQNFQRRMRGGLGRPAATTE